MFKVGDRVRVRANEIHAVKSYQLKGLNFRRLVGVVKRVHSASESAEVDFCQHDMPALYNGIKPGARTRLTKKVGDGSKGFPFAILEKVR